MLQEHKVLVCSTQHHRHAPLAELQAPAGGIHHHVLDVAHAAAAADELELRQQSARRHHPPRARVCTIQGYAIDMTYSIKCELCGSLLSLLLS